MFRTWKSRAFYAAALAPLGMHVRKELDDDGVLFGGVEPVPGEDPAGEFCLLQAEVPRERPHVAFRARTREQVDAFYQAALAAGGTDNGAPGLRPQYHGNYYAAFVRDWMATTSRRYAIGRALDEMIGGLLRIRHGGRQGSLFA